MATVENAVNSSEDCEQHPQLENIKKLVQEYITDTDWSTLWIGVVALVDCNNEEYRGGSSSPDAAGFRNSTQLISLLLRAGLPVDAADSEGYTMLHGAARAGHLPLVKLLVDSGANVNIAAAYGHTPLMYAASFENLELVQYLVQVRADTTARNKYGYSARDTARRSKQREVEQYLLQLPH